VPSPKAERVAACPNHFRMFRSSLHDAPVRAASSRSPLTLSIPLDCQSACERRVIRGSLLLYSASVPSSRGRERFASQPLSEVQNPTCLLRLHLQPPLRAACKHLTQLRSAVQGVRISRFSTAAVGF
jgi:hypothetical protein